MFKIGEKVENFEREAYQNDQIKRVKLSDYKGKWVILFFYPADFTFVCPTELEEMADNYDKFKELGAEILSVSTDTVWVHKAWHDASKAIKKINFPMVSDPTGNLCRAYGTYMDEEGLSVRGSFIIDPEGTLKAYELNDNSIGRNAEELIRKLEASIYVSKHHGEVCPASWKPGQKVLKPGLDIVGKI
jgi:NADH-dependent peroxiredoxin subunit C